MPKTERLFAMLFAPIVLLILFSSSYALSLPEPGTSADQVKELHLVSKEGFNLAFMMVSEPTASEMRVFVSQSPGKRISDAQVTVAIADQQGGSVLANAEPQRGGYTLNVPRQSDGTYYVTASIEVDGDFITERFIYSVN